MIDLSHTMITGDVSRVLGVSVNRVRQLDEELQPIRLQNGSRRYSPERVAEVLAKRVGK